MIVRKKNNKKKKKGFTLIELLAVIVILGLLVAIAIPSITKYIIQSRKKTVVSSIDSYISATLNAVNEQDYNFTTPNTIYALPIECIAIEKGGTNPFGEWMQASNDYWSYVLVQYDSEEFSYNYGFTFKDSSGYGMYPTIQSEIKPKSTTQIKTGLELSKPISGRAIDIATEDNWNGFDINDATQLVVLEATSEGDVGDGKNTCTLYQKGENYDQVEYEKANRPRGFLSDLIMSDNELINATPTLTTSSNNTSDASGLYSSIDTNDESITYYFRGNVTNNNVRFANLDWKIIRINEDGTIRLILNGTIDKDPSQFNSSKDNFSYTYYSNGSIAKAQVDNWYQTNIEGNGFDSYVSNGTFCEQAKTKSSSTNTIGNASLTLYSSYTPDFKCTLDGNEKGKVKNGDTLVKVGLMSYDEVVYAGGYLYKENKNYYLYNKSFGMWTMSPCSSEGLWFLYSNGSIRTNYVTDRNSLRPVINLNANVIANGLGTEDKPYKILKN